MRRHFVDKLFDLVADLGPDEDINDVVAGLMLVTVNLMYENSETDVAAEKLLKSALTFTIKEHKKDV